MIDQKVTHTFYRAIINYHHYSCEMLCHRKRISSERVPF